jgi:uncharacterized protein (TIGR02453 family)
MRPPAAAQVIGEDVRVPDAPLPFGGFPPEAFTWFAGLEADNSRAWFAANRAAYEEAVRGPLEAMLDALAAELGGDVRLFRQHRDVRFSADKSPYKTRAYGVVQRPDRPAGLYLEVSSAGLLAGTGYHVMAPDQLARFRAAVADPGTGPPLAAAVAAVRDAGIDVFGEALRTAPRGFPRDHPRVALLRHRALGTARRLAPGPDGIAAGPALEHARTTWAAGAGVVAWLDEHVGASAVPPEERYGPRRGR